MRQKTALLETPPLSSLNDIQLKIMEKSRQIRELTTSLFVDQRAEWTNKGVAKHNLELDDKTTIRSAKHASTREENICSAQSAAITELPIDAGWQERKGSMEHRSSYNILRNRRIADKGIKPEGHRIIQGGGAGEPDECVIR